MSKILKITADSLENIKHNSVNFLILLPIIWTFTGMFLYPNGKKFMVVLIIISTITSFFFYGLKNIKCNLKYNKLLWLLGASSILAIVADIYYGFSSSQLRAFISVFIYLTILPPTVTKKINLKYLTILGSITSTIYVFIQVYILEVGRSWDINPLPYATFIASIAILTFYFLLESKNIKQRIQWLLIFISTLLPLFYSQSRGLWLAVAVTILVLLLKSILTKNKITWLFILIVTIITLTLMTQLDTVTKRVEITKNEVLQIFNGNLHTSIGARLQLWQAAPHLINDSPIIGLGDTHVERKKELAKQNIISEQIIIFTHYHNQFIDAVVRYGVIGLSLLLCTIALPIYYFFKNNSEHKWPGALIVLIYTIASLTDVPFHHAQTLTLYFLIIYITLCGPIAQPTPTLTQREVE